MYNKYILTQLQTKILINKRFHIGEHSKKLNKNINAYIYGIRHDVLILHPDKLIQRIYYLVYILNKFFTERSTFLLLNLNSSVNTRYLLEDFHFDLKNLTKTRQNLMLGFLDQKWYNGIISN